MDTFFDVMPRVLDWSFIVMSTLVAFVAWSATLGLLWYARAQRQSAVPVHVRVQTLHEEPRADGKVLYRPEFVITAGAYKGRTCKGNVASNPKSYVRDEQCRGLYQPKTGVIVTAKTTKLLQRIAIALAVIGSLAGAGAVYIALQLGS